MNALPVILAAWLVVLTALAAYALWRMVFHVQHLNNELKVIVSAIGRPIHTPNQTDYSYIKEGKPLKGEAALAFFRGFHQSQFWQPLSHKFQADTRELLLQAHSLIREGKAEAATFLAGEAFYASQQAVLVEREIATIGAMLQRIAEDKKLDELTGIGEVPRPARY